MRKMRFDPNRPELRVLSKMTYRDLKLACIVRDMEFQDIVEADHGRLSTFFIRNFDSPQDIENLENFDIWMDQQLAKRGYDPNDPVRAFKLSSTIDPETDDFKVARKKVSKAVKIPKKKRKKVERNETFNVVKGTKKEYTMELAKKLADLGKKLDSKKLQEKLIARVREKYPDANAKSIMIWYKRAVNELQKKA